MTAEANRIAFAGTYTPANARVARWTAGSTDSGWVLLAAVGVILLLLPFIADPRIGGLNAAVIWACGVYISYAVWLRPEIRAHRAWKAQNWTMSGSISDAGVEFRWDGSLTQADWSNFNGSKTTRSMILLFDSARRPIYLPRDFFATEQDWTAAAELVKSKVQRR